MDFYNDGPGVLPPTQVIRVRAAMSGTIDAAVTFWEAYGDDDRTQVSVLVKICVLVLQI